MQRKNFSSETYWEPLVGYSRSVRIGDYVYVSGTTSTDKEGNIIGINDPYAQTVQIIKNIEIALQAVDANLKDVVRTRIYVTDINNWEKIGQAHADFFREISPTSTLVEVSRLINADMLVEIEVDAIINNCE